MDLIHFTQAEGIRLELVKRKDAPTIAAFLGKLIEYGLGWSWTMARVAKHIQHADSMVVVAREDKSVRGLVLMQFMEKPPI